MNDSLLFGAVIFIGVIGVWLLVELSGLREDVRKLDARDQVKELQHIAITLRRAVESLDKIEKNTDPMLAP